MDNKRRNQRFTFYESVGYQKTEPLPPEGSLCEDISLSGLKLNVNEFIPINTTLGLQLKLPGQNTIVNVNAKVVWVRESPKCLDAWQLGLELMDNNSPFSNIENYLRARRFDTIA